MWRRWRRVSDGRCPATARTPSSAAASRTRRSLSMMWNGQIKYTRVLASAERDDSANRVVQPFEPHGNDRELEPRRDHRDTWSERNDFRFAIAFRKNQNRIAVCDHLADVAQGLAGSGPELRQRKRVECERRAKIVEAV